MKKTDLKIGEEYAVGSSSRYDRFSLSHVRVLELDGERLRPDGRMARGIVAEFVEDGVRYPFGSVKAGTVKVFESGRDFVRPWTKYVEAKLAEEERRAAIRAENDRIREVGTAACVRLRELGLEPSSDYLADFHWTGNQFQVSADDMMRLLDKIPS